MFNVPAEFDGVEIRLKMLQMCWLNKIIYNQKKN